MSEAGFYSLTMPRIMGVEKKQRMRINTSIEREIVECILHNSLDIANTVNIALEKYLREKNYL